jgi:hypothetical protein
MLSEWQIVLLDNGLWIVPLMGLAALCVFPWKHWNGLLSEDGQARSKRRRSGPLGLHGSTCSRHCCRDL